MATDIGNIISIYRALVTGRWEHINNGEILAFGLKESFFGGLDNVFLAILPKGHINAVFQYSALFINTATIARCIITHLLQNIINMVDKYIVPGIT